MYKDKLEALCVLNDKVVFQEAHTVRVSGYTGDYMKGVAKRVLLLFYIRIAPASVSIKYSNRTFTLALEIQINT